jgi:hypothetical protein
LRSIVLATVLVYVFVLQLFFALHDIHCSIVLPASDLRDIITFRITTGSTSYLCDHRYSRKKALNGTNHKRPTNAPGSRLAGPHPRQNHVHIVIDNIDDQSTVSFVDPMSS